MKHIFTLFTSLLLTGFLQAQDFEVAPVVLNFNANPGEIQQTVVTIRNHANIKQAYTFNLGDFEIDSTGRKMRMPAGESRRSCANWITVSPSFVELNPNEEREITVIMTVPKDGTSSKWGMIYVQAATEQDEDPIDKQLATGVKVVPRIVILVNQSPTTNSNYKGTISNLVETTTPADTARTFNVEIVNTGDKIIEAKVQLALANLETAQEQKFKSTMQRLYPGEKRIFTLSLPKNISGSGEHALAAILDYGHGTNLEGTQIIIEL
ncbi:MAG: hypothetical protein P8I55_13940 [Crocinitomix sp.]|nr:hypothetical protein [Crocinitomix sp.]